MGSFLNVVIYRLPRGLSVNKPTYSFCPNCKNRLTIPDLVPILSWAFLKGKCRHCGQRVSPRYAVVEIINGSLWGAIWWLYLVETPDVVKAVGFALFAAALVSAIFTDLAHYIIPDQINAFMLIVGIGMNIAYFVLGREEAWVWGMPGSLAGWLAGVGVLWGIALLGRLLFHKDAMGHGDIKMARGIGAVLLPFNAFLSFGLAIVLGAVLGIVQILARRKQDVPEEAEVEEEHEEPETIGSLFICGIGYVLCIDAIGLIWTKLYEKWFGENPYSVEEFEDEPEVELTMIPFGPYLAAGALGVILFEKPLHALVEAYVRQITGG